MEMSSQSIKSYVISLETAQQRREHITREFSDKGIAFEFFDAISPFNRMQDITKELIPALEENNTLSNGEKGCLLSHLALWKRCIDEHLDYVAIFEDDVLLNDDIHLFLNNDEWLNNLLKENVIVKLETFFMPVELDCKEVNKYANREISILRSIHYGTAGYIISRSASKYLLDTLYHKNKDELLAVDQIIFNQLLTNEVISIYQVNPALCLQELQANKKESQLTSQIQEERKNVSAICKPGFWEKLLGSYKRKKRRKLEEKVRKDRNYRVIDF